MYQTLRHHASVAFCMARLTIQGQLQYPMFLLSWAVGIPIQSFVGIWLLKTMVQQFDSLAGWTFPQLAFLYGLSLVSHGLQVIFFIQTWFVSDYVTNGDFDRYLLRPLNVFFQFIIQYVNLIGVLDLIPGIIIFLYGANAVGFTWTIPHLLQVGGVVFGAVLIRAASYLIVGSVAFWTQRSSSLTWMMMGLMDNATIYPVSIYPRFIQSLFTFIMPLAFISFYPACDFLKQESNLGFSLTFVLWTPLVGLGYFVLAQMIFLRGLQRYESAGS